ncbi:hypothetical protein [Streptomyces platensis]|uniref:hypothetical protein n=1 Tax=Streptomyces platensis TaxID=58346 RepID=UPI0033165578
MDSSQRPLVSDYTLATSTYLARFAGDFTLGLVIGFVLHAIAGRHTSPWPTALLVGAGFLGGRVFSELLVIVWHQVRGTRQFPTHTTRIKSELLAELHRRTTRYESGDITNPDILMNVAGELVGLRTAVGVAHGYQAATPECHDAARRLYAAWVTHWPKHAARSTRT